jgi:hypothetical protein
VTLRISNEAWSDAWVDCERTFRAAVGREAVGVAYSSCSRKEVIQPQVPLRLPCYDFAPVTDLAFGRSLSEELGHGLRALPASMA